MSEAAELERALAEMAAFRVVQVHENGRWLAALSTLRYEVRSQGGSTLIHLWSDERNLVRRILRVAEQSADRLVLEVQRFGRSKPDRLEFSRADWERPATRQAREKFRNRFRQLLSEQFPDEQIDSLSTSADLEHSFSGCYARGLMHRGSRAWAVLGVSASEDTTTVDAILTFGLLWLNWTRERAGGRVAGCLRLFLPEGLSRVTCHRLSALAPSTPIELYELEETRGRARRPGTSL